MLTEAARTSRPRLGKSKNKKSVDPARVLHVLGDHILLDGFKIVLDQEKSRGSYLYDAANGQRLIDLYGFFGSMPIGFNHPYFDQPDVAERSSPRGESEGDEPRMFIQRLTPNLETFARVAGLPPLDKYLFIEGWRAHGREHAQSGNGSKFARTWRPATASAERRFCIFVTRFMVAAVTP